MAAVLNLDSATDLMTLDAQLRDAVGKYLKDHTRYALARDAGVQYKTLCRWLDEGRDIKLSTAQKLAEFFGLVLKPEE